MFRIFQGSIGVSQGFWKSSLWAVRPRHVQPRLFLWSLSVFASRVTTAIGPLSPCLYFSLIIISVCWLNLNFWIHKNLYNKPVLINRARWVLFVYCNTSKYRKSQPFFFLAETHKEPLIYKLFNWRDLMLQAWRKKMVFDSS